ncbi:MAG: type IV pilus assembly protein PilM [Deltaproteobacteria bacterium]|nr:type IV pilus assembly protein PilM [Deltaproteobacteria bacterium]
MALFGKKKGVIGVDIGSSAIKIVELKDTKKGYQLTNYGIVPLPSEVIVDGAIMDSSAIVEAIKNLLAEKKMKTRDAAISVSGHSVIIKKITLPVMTEAELEESIQWEAEQYIPFPISDVNIDFHILEMAPGQPQMDVLIVAVKKDMINDYTAAIAEAGLNPVVVDVDSFALENMYCINYDIVPEETVALVNMGANITNINILKGGTSTLTRDVSVGGRQITNEIQKHAGVSFEDAEILKCGGEVNGVDSKDIDAIVKFGANALVTEVQRSLNFYLSTSHEGKIDRVYLGGGSSKIKGIADVIAERTGFPTELIDPFLKIGFNQKTFDPDALKKDAPLLCVGVGLATRRPGDK